MTETTPTTAGEPGRSLVLFFRWGFPGLVILGAVVAYLLDPSTLAAEGAAGVIGAGLSWILFGWLFRKGQEGDQERHVEDAARDYLTEHGTWPTDEQYEVYKRHGRWTAPPAATA